MLPHALIDHVMDGNDDIHTLRRKLREAREREAQATREAERQRKRADSQQERAESERKRAESERKRAESERRRAEQAEHESRRTTLVEYIGNCHRLLDLRVEVESDKSLTSKGSVTDPQNKYLPSRLSAWPDFLDTQRRILGRLHSTFPAHERAFESVGFLRGLGDRLASRRVANEGDVAYVQHSSVEDPVSHIVQVLCKNDAARKEFGLANGVVFENHPNALSDGAEEPARRRAAHDPNQLRADQLCVYMYDEADPTRRTLAFVAEHKASHKLTLPHLRLGLREMDIQDEVVDRATVPTDPAARFQYHADKVVAAALAQTYHYMITGGLEYSFVTTGEAYVFLKIDWADPGHLFFHLAEPRVEADAHPDNFTHCTAVSQVLAFTLLAMESRPHGQDERHAAIERIGTWTEDYEAILRRMPATERKQTPPPSAFQPRTYKHVDRSPYIFRVSRTGASCRPVSRDSGDRELPDQSDDDTAGPHGSPSLRGSRRAPRQAQLSSDGRRHGSADAYQPRQYCTQKCLLGLVNGGPLDMACPNVLSHQEHHPERVRHPLDPTTWRRLLQDQLAESLDAHVSKLWKQGARGAALKVTLAAYGYTVVAKGTVPEFVEDLRHEASMYTRLKPLQGVGVPVFLGAVGLERPFFYDHRVCLVQLILLSWAGNPVSTRTAACDHDLEDLEKTMRHLGVIHGDVRDPNILWCPETNRPMLIDFERATLATPLTKTKRTRYRGSRRRISADAGRRLQPIAPNGQSRLAANHAKWSRLFASREEPRVGKLLVERQGQKDTTPASGQDTEGLCFSTGRCTT